MSDLRFDPVEHRYWLGVRELPSVTRILDASGLLSPFAKQDWAARRGQIVHMACALMVQGKLDFSTVDPRIAGYLESYQKVLDHTGWIAKAVEEKNCDEILRFAGTYDVSYEQPWIIDLKTGSPEPWHTLQTAAYNHLGGSIEHPHRRGCLYLQADGSIGKLKEHRDRTDFKYFISFLNSYQWREAHNGNGNR